MWFVIVNQARQSPNSMAKIQRGVISAYKKDTYINSSVCQTLQKWKREECN